MKVLDVDSLMTGLQEGVQDIDRLHGKVSAMQRSIRDFYAMKDALSGKGGEAIRSFFNEVHQPFLLFLYQSLQEYKNVLSKMQDSVDAFEPNPSGLIRQDFLENEVTDGFEKVKNRTVELTDDANSIISNVQDLVWVNRIDDTEVLDTVERGKKNVRNIVEDLHTLDKSQMQAMESARADLETMRHYLAGVESKVSSGNLSVVGFDFGVLKDVDGYSAMMEEIYGDGNWGLPRKVVGKLAKGETLTPYETDILYNYFQNEVLDDGKRKEIEGISSFINEKDIKRLTERLNEKVVISQDALEEEMEMVQAYVFLGTNMPSQTGVDYYARPKMEAYLMLLKGYHTRMVEDNTVIRVGKIEYEKNHNDISGHFLESVVETVRYNTDEDIMNIERFREWVFNDPDNFIMPQIEYTTITYATGAGASKNIRGSELKSLKEEYADYEANFIMTKVLNKTLSEISKKMDISGYVDAAKTVIGFDAGKKEMEDSIELDQALLIASSLNLEVAIGEQNPGKGMNIQFYPLDGTFNKIERWEELHKENPNLYFPDKEINASDWHEISKSLYEIEVEYPKIYSYIYDGTTNGQSIESLANGK